MPIVFYFMNGCGFCVKAKKMFAEELKNGKMVMKPSSSAPAGVRGFPTFEYKGKTQSGLPSSKESLYNKLGYKNTTTKENFSMQRGTIPNCMIGVL